MSTTRPTRTSWTVRTPEDLGRALAGARLARALTQAATAHATGIERTYLARLEAGSWPLVVERVLRILRRLGATVTISIETPDGSPDEAA